MKLRLIYLPVMLILFSFNNLSSQNQRLSEITRQITEPEIICTMAQTGIQSNVRILQSDQIKSRINNRATPCATFNVNYDAGFTLNNEARDAFDFAVNIWANSIESSVPITIDANLVSLSNPNTIGSASNGGFFEVAGQPANTTYHSALAEKLLGSEIINSSGNSVDITINMNQNFNFYYGIDPNGISPSETDFITIVLHEIGHGLGMSGRTRTIGSNGAVRFSGDLFTAYDSFLVRDRGIFGEFSLLQSFNDPSPELLTAFTSDEIATTSPRAISANSGDNPKIYSPSSFAGGSSISHLDESTFNFTSNALMTPFASANEVVRNPGEIVLGLFEDMGWSICKTGALSTDQDFLSSTTKIFPNPFEEYINILLPEGIDPEEFNYSILDISGKVILEVKNIQNLNLTIKNLNILENGVYFLNISNITSSTKFVKKIIKQN